MPDAPPSSAPPQGAAPQAGPSNAPPQGAPPQAAPPQAAPPQGEDPGLERFRAVSLDCYGTLIDWEEGIWRSLAPLVERAGGGAAPSRAAALEAHARAESRVQAEAPEMPYPLVLEATHEALEEELGIAGGAALRRAHGASVPDWPAFPDSGAALRRLSRRFRIFLLSNVDRASLAGSVRRLGFEPDAAWTAEEMGFYKPDPRAFSFLAARARAGFGIEAGELLHAAQSLFHDHAPAAAAGLARVWIDRGGIAGGGGWGATPRLPAGAEPPPPLAVFPSMAEFAAAAAP